MAMKESTKKILEYVKSMEGQNITEKDIADAVGVSPRSVTGSVTSFQKKGFMVRKPAEIENEDGTHTAIKLVAITEEGKAFVPED